MCEEVGRPRQMSVELRCCTVDEIGHWLESKKQRARGQSKQRAAGHRHEEEMEERKHGGRHPDNDDIPLAVLVSVQESEEEVCQYRSRVCTPLLCPEPAKAKQSATSTTSSSTPLNKPKMQVHNAQHTQDGGEPRNPINDIMDSLFGGQMNNVDGDGEVRVIMADGETAEAFQELIQQSDNIDIMDTPQFKKVKELLNKQPNQEKIQELLKQLNTDSETEDNMNGKSTVQSKMIEVKEGDSIREILEKTLASKRRPCLFKNLGW